MNSQLTMVPGLGRSYNPGLARLYTMLSDFREQGDIKAIDELKHAPINICRPPSGYCEGVGLVRSLIGKDKLGPVSDDEQRFRISFITGFLRELSNLIAEKTSSVVSNSYKLFRDLGACPSITASGRPDPSCSDQANSYRSTLKSLSQSVDKLSTLAA